MPAPNLGFVGARGVGALQDEIRQMEAERRAQEMLDYKRRQDEQAAAELTRYRKAQEYYQLKDLETRQEANRLSATKVNPGSIIQVRGTAPRPGETGKKYIRGMREDTGDVLWSQEEIDEPNVGTSGENQHIAGVNEKRAKAGLPPLDPDQRLVEAKRYHDAVRPPPDPALSLGRDLNNQLKQAQLAMPLSKPQQDIITDLSKGFTGDQFVREFRKIGEAVNFVNSIGDRNNPNDDSALIYAFAKAMDPDSAVREQEGETIRKNSQSWFEKFGFDAQRVFERTAFLTPEARADIRATIHAAFQSRRQGYESLRNEYSKQIELATRLPDAGQYLIDYAAGYVPPQNIGGRDLRALAGGGGATSPAVEPPLPPGPPARAGGPGPAGVTPPPPPPGNTLPMGTTPYKGQTPSFRAADKTWWGVMNGQPVKLTGTPPNGPWFLAPTVRR